MPRTRKPPRLFLRNEDGRKGWVILDYGRSIRTGFSEDDADKARERLEQYRDGTFIAPRTDNAIIYYVTCPHSNDYPVKIGYTALSMSQRLRQFQQGNPNVLVCLATEFGTLGVERERHKRWRHLHIRSEWFRRDPALMDFIQSLHSVRVYT
ncbi:GIY-YIG nuclease family protein [Mesorhizobium sp. M7A.F.Ca.MR.362.00.0.0]|uniref:GIY-YIG nuclease family protein n=1 Tax=Mesorhizobium sp. M7A.F.Ca.MR.362.00.0.0 TaxID=2496779 RepID=UPI000FD44657|nr:GIY-YIG nuclease family protein [Mesorhizobium sp. M7A.F.Ca.MR.362.00.0.0]